MQLVRQELRLVHGPEIAQPWTREVNDKVKIYNCYKHIVKQQWTLSHSYVREWALTNRAGLELTRTQSCPKSCAKAPGMDQDTGDGRGHGRGWSGCRGHDQAVPLEVTGNSETPAELWPPSRMLLIPCRDSSLLPVARTTSAAGLLQSTLRSQLFPATASSESFKRPECPD